MVGAYDQRFRCGKDFLPLQLFLFAGARVGTVKSAGYHYSIDQQPVF
jgi:hypothetical protein